MILATPMSLICQAIADDRRAEAQAIRMPRGFKGRKAALDRQAQLIRICHNWERRSAGQQLTNYHFAEVVLAVLA